jgi:Transposase
VKDEFSFYVGVDWGVEFHQACILDAKGEKICQRRIEHSGLGMLEFCDFLQALTNGKASALAVAIEVPRVPIVEALLEQNYAVFSINPKQLDRFRDRHAVAGAKDDRRDAYIATDSLRTDQHCFRRVMPDHPDVMSGISPRKSSIHPSKHLTAAMGEEATATFQLSTSASTQRLAAWRKCERYLPAIQHH